MKCPTCGRPLVRNEYGPPYHARREDADHCASLRRGSARGQGWAA